MNPRYESLDGRVKAVKIAFGLMAVVALGVAISDAFEVAMLNRVIAGEELSDAALDASDDRQALLGMVSFVVYIACIVTFIRWLSRAYRNLDAVARGIRRHGHGWAIGGWFVPILNLWRPKEIVNDVWRSGGTEPPPLLGVWWGGFIVSNWLSNIALRSAFTGDTPEEIRNGSIAYLIADGFDAPLALLAIWVVVATTRQIDGRARAVADQTADVSRLEENSSEAPTDAPSTATMTASETPTGK
jgi:hypothetical protein